MGLLRSLLTFPVTGPVQGATWAITQVHKAAEAEFNDPAKLYAELADLERALLAGEIGDAAYDAAETEILDRLDAKMGKAR